MTDELRQLFLRASFIIGENSVQLVLVGDFVQAFWCSSEETWCHSNVLGNKLCSCVLVVLVFPTI